MTSDRMTTAEIVKMLRLHEQSIRGVDMVLRFSAQLGSPAAAEYGPDNGTMVAVEVTKHPKTKGLHEVRFANRDDVAWERIDMLIERVVEAEAKVERADAIIAADHAGDFDIEAHEEALRMEGEARHRQRVDLAMDHMRQTVEAAP